MVVKVLSVRDALTNKLVRVLSDQHPKDTPCVADTVRAVFNNEEDGAFLGLVTEQHITQYPQRIFADLVPRPFPAPLPEGTPLESLQNLLDGEVSAIAVTDGKGGILGAVTQASLFAALLAWHEDAQQKTDALLEENRRLTQRLFANQEQVNRYVAHELHDEMGQYCTAIQANIQTIIEINKEADQQIHERCLSTLDLCDHVHETMQSILRRLRPALLDEMGLEYALQELVSSWGNAHSHIEYQLDMAGQLDNLAEPLNIAIFRITQECLTNIARHAEATSVVIQLHRQDAMNDGREDIIRLMIKDNGKGFSDPLHNPGQVAINKGLGLTGIRERVFGLGGVLFIDSKPHEGACIMIEVPVNHLA